MKSVDEETSFPGTATDNQTRKVLFTLNNETECGDNGNFKTTTVKKSHQAPQDDTSLDVLNTKSEQSPAKLRLGSGQEEKTLRFDAPQEADISDDENEREAGGYFLPQEFLQRAPSHITVRELTTPDKRFNTYPNLPSEFEKEKRKLQKSQLRSQISSPGSISKSDLIPRKEVGEILGTKFNDVCDVTDNPAKHQINAKSRVDRESDDEEFFDAVEVLYPNDENKKENFGVVNNNSLCMECVKPIQIITGNEVHPGSHIAFPGAIYDHHAIVVDVLQSDTRKGEICVELVHATNTSAKATLASLHPFGNKARLRHVKETINFHQKKVMVYKYSAAITQFSSADIVNRAKSEARADLEGGEGKFKYNVFKNNCEHFATWCVTGRKLSLQERKVSMVFWMFLGSGFNGISDEKMRNEKEYEYGMLCENCYTRNKKLFSVPQNGIRKASDVNPGDIITYSYYNLWHAAVVLEIIKSEEKFVICDIAHYAFCGIFSQRTIINENLKIPFDGTVKVTCYPANYNVYTSIEVVQRAKDRLGEQQFAFFSNDSSQFVRWCKLKLTRT